MDRWIEEVVAERHEQWLREGIEEGLKEGMKAATLSLAIRQLTRKFGRLDAAL